MSFNVDKAIEFVFQNGNAFQQVYFKALFERNLVEHALLSLARYQNDDGGFFGLDSDYNGKASSITCTMIALSKLERLGLDSGVLYDATIAYLQREQKKKGFWDESYKVLESQPPKWYYPKYMINQVWFTNGILRYLVTKRNINQDMLEKAQSFLRSHWNGSSFPGYDHNNWMAVVGFHNSDQMIHRQITESCMYNLINHISEYDLGDINWVLESMMSMQISSSHPVVVQGLELLENGQREDGGLSTSYGELHRVDTTIDALDTLAFYNRIQRKI